MHLRNHGLTLVGESIEAVVLEAIWLEHHARMTTWATAAGTPRGMSAANADVKATERFGDAARWQHVGSTDYDTPKMRDGGYVQVESGEHGYIRKMPKRVGCGGA